MPMANDDVVQNSPQTDTSTSAGPRAMPGCRSSTWLRSRVHWATLPTTQTYVFRIYKSWKCEGMLIN